MSEADEIQIININNIFKEEYKLNKKKIILEENLEKLLDIQSEGKIAISAQIIEKYIVIIYVKVKNLGDLDNKKVKDIQLDNFSIVIIKYDQKNNNKQQIVINIPIKKEINIPKKNFMKQKFYFFDLIPIENSESFFILYFLDQLHFFKLYKKEEQLKYNKIKIKNFNNDTTVYYLGKNIMKNKNIIEIELLLKPSNNFYFIPINITEPNKKLEEKEFILSDKKNNEILNKFTRSNCEYFLFKDKNSNQNYIVTKDESNKEIVINELIINDIEKNVNGNIKLIFLFKILDKFYIISDISKVEEEKNEYIIFGIFNLLYVEKDKNYNMELLQKIQISNKEGIKDYNFNINIENYISINIGQKFYFIHIDQNGIVDMINIYQIDSKLNFDKFFYDKSQELTLLIFFLNNDISFSKFIDEFYKNEKYVQNNGLENKEDKSNEIIKIEEKTLHEQNLINEKPLEKNEIDENNSNKNNSQIFGNVPRNSIVEYKIEKIINDRIELHKNKLNKLVKEKEKKIKLIKKDIKEKKEEKEILKLSHSNILKVLNHLQKLKNENNKYYEEEEVEEEFNNNNNYNFNQNYNNIYQLDINEQYNNHLINPINNPQYQAMNSMNYNYPQYSYKNNNQINSQMINQLYNNRNMNMDNLNNFQ